MFVWSSSYVGKSRSTSVASYLLLPTCFATHYEVWMSETEWSSFFLMFIVGNVMMSHHIQHTPATLTINFLSVVHTQMCVSILQQKNAGEYQAQIMLLCKSYVLLMINENCTIVVRSCGFYLNTILWLSICRAGIFIVRAYLLICLTHSILTDTCYGTTQSVVRWTTTQIIQCGVWLELHFHVVTHTTECLTETRSSTWVSELMSVRARLGNIWNFA